jgi:hypothetical protein
MVWGTNIQPGIRIFSLNKHADLEYLLTNISHNYKIVSPQDIQVRNIISCKIYKNIPQVLSSLKLKKNDI